MYVRGVTAYDYSHLGHARAAVSFEILFRYLKHLGYEVTYLRNFTVVDDKIIKQANETGEDPLKLSNRFCDEYDLDMAYLQCERPSGEPHDMISQTLQDCKETLSSFQQEGNEENKNVPRVEEATKECIKKMSIEFQTKMSDDLQTPVIILVPYKRP